MDDPEYKLCPFCAEDIKANAVKCSHCNTNLDDESVRDAEKIRSKIFKKNIDNGQRDQLQEDMYENDILEKKEHDEKQKLKEVENAMLSETDEKTSVDRFHTQPDGLLEKPISGTSNNNASKQPDTGLHETNNVESAKSIEQTDQEGSLIDADKIKEVDTGRETIKSWCSIVAWCSYIGSAIFIGIGFYKMFAYYNPDKVTYKDPVNAYVGGDAYNFIINANYATAYFTLAIFCAVIGMTAMIGYFLTKD